MLGKHRIFRHCDRTNRLLELAIDDQDYKKNEHGDDRNRYNPICSHPVPKSAR